MNRTVTGMQLNLKKLKRIFNEPYPFYYFKERSVLVFFAVFVFSFLFSYLFEPFIVYRPEHRMGYVWICFIHSALATAIAWVYFLVLERLVKSYHQWTVGKEFMHIGILLLLIGIGSFLVRDSIYTNPNNWSVRYFIEEIRNTFLVGMLILSIVVPLNYIRLLKDNRASVNQLGTAQNKPLIQDLTAINIRTQLKGDDFLLRPQQLLVARTDGNYTEFFIESGSQIQKLVKRITLSDLERQLQPFPFIIKTHRAWIVNLYKVEKVKGNAQGYQLDLPYFMEKVPVSRNFIAVFNSKYPQ